MDIGNKKMSLSQSNKSQMMDGNKKPTINEMEIFLDRLIWIKKYKEKESIIAEKVCEMHFTFLYASFKPAQSRICRRPDYHTPD